MLCFLVALGVRPLQDALPIQPSGTTPCTCHSQNLLPCLHGLSTTQAHPAGKRLGASTAPAVAITQQARKEEAGLSPPTGTLSWLRKAVQGRGQYAQTLFSPAATDVDNTIWVERFLSRMALIACKPNLGSYPCRSACPLPLCRR